MTRWFLDTEFDENGSTIKLISIALVNEDDSERYYRVLSDGWQAEECNEWVRANVVPLLGDGLRASRQQVAADIRAMLLRGGKKPSIWGYFSDYDGGWADKRDRKGGEDVKVYQGYRSKAGIARDVPLYALRHTCACQLLLGSQLFTGGRQWSREEIQSQLGHRDSKATEHYLRALGILGRRAALESREALKKNKGRA